MCVCVGSIFFLCGKRTSYFSACRELAQLRLFLLTSTCTHSSLPSVCERDRDRHRDREFFFLDTYFGGCNKTDLQNGDFVGAHTHTHTHPFQIQKGSERGCEFSLQHPSFGGSFVSRDNVLLRKPSRRRRHFPFADRFFCKPSMRKKGLIFKHYSLIGWGARFCLIVNVCACGCVERVMGAWKYTVFFLL